MVDGELLIAGGLVVVDADDDPRPRDILVRDGLIQALAEPGTATASERVEAAGCILIPGLINGHVHSSGNVVRSLSERWNLELQLNAGPAFRGEQLDREKYLTALVGAVEMVSRGCTACYDIFYEFPLPSPTGFNQVARAYRDVGMRAVVAPMVADRGIYDVVPGLLDALPEPARSRIRNRAPGDWRGILAAIEAVLAGWDGGDLVGYAVAPTIPMHCSDDFLRESAAFARVNGVGFHTHLAESKVQAVYGRERYGRSITAHLQAIGVLGPAFTGAHAVWIDAEDARMLAGEGASVAHNPGANLRLGVGVADLTMMRDAGLTVAIGTDSRVCSDNLNMFEAARLASRLTRVHGYDHSRWLSAREIFRMATEGGAAALGQKGRLGRLAPGHAADIVFLDRGNTNWVPLVDIYNQLVHAEDATAVRHVMIGGRMVYRDRAFPGLDLPARFAEVQAASDRLVTANRPALAEVAKLEEAVTRICGGLASQPLPESRWVGQGASPF